MLVSRPRGCGSRGPTCSGGAHDYAYAAGLEDGHGDDVLARGPEPVALPVITRSGFAVDVVRSRGVVRAAVADLDGELVGVGLDVAHESITVAKFLTFEADMKADPKSGEPRRRGRALWWEARRFFATEIRYGDGRGRRLRLEPREEQGPALDYVPSHCAYSSAEALASGAGDDIAVGGDGVYEVGSTLSRPGSQMMASDSKGILGDRSTR